MILERARSQLRLLDTLFGILRDQKEPQKGSRDPITRSLSRVRICDPVDRSPPGSSVRGIFQAGTLEWVAVSYSRGS